MRFVFDIEDIVDATNDQVAEATRSEVERILRTRLHRPDLTVQVQPTPTVLVRPMTVDQIKNGLDADGYISGIIYVDLTDLLSEDLEYVLDLFSEKLIGSSLGMDIDYEVIGTDKGSLLIQVTLNPSMALEDDNG